MSNSDPSEKQVVPYLPTPWIWDGASGYVRVTSANGDLVPGCIRRTEKEADKAAAAYRAAHPECVVPLEERDAWFAEREREAREAQVCDNSSQNNNALFEYAIRPLGDDPRVNIYEVLWKDTRLGTAKDIFEATALMTQHWMVEDAKRQAELEARRAQYATSRRYRGFHIKQLDADVFIITRYRQQVGQTTSMAAAERLCIAMEEVGVN